jgi:hypothetical protein
MKGAQRDESPTSPKVFSPVILQKRRSEQVGGLVREAEEVKKPPVKDFDPVKVKICKIECDEPF